MSRNNTPPEYVNWEASRILFPDLQALQPRTGLEAFRALEGIFEWLLQYDSKQKADDGLEEQPSTGKQGFGDSTNRVYSLSPASTPTTPQSPEKLVRSL